MSAVAEAGAPLLAIRRARGHSRSTVRRRDLALGTAAAAVAGLPLLAPTGPAGTAPEDALILVAVGAAALWAGRTEQRLRFPYGIPIALFMAGGILGALVGPVPGAGLTAVVQDAMLLVWCWAFMNVASDARRLGVLLATWAYSSIAWASLLFGGLLTGTTFLSGQTAREGSRTALTFGDPNVSANYYVISMMIIWATGRPRRRRWRLLAHALLVAAILSTGSNSGVVSTIVAVSLTSVLGIRRRRGPVAAATLAAFLAATAVVATSTVSFRSIQHWAYTSNYAFIRDGLGRGEVSVDQRDTLLHESLRLYESGGMLGQGPVSTKPRLASEMAPFVKEAHNDYLAALTERGVLGAFALILFMSGLVVRGVRLARARLRPSLGAVLPRSHAIVGALAGTMTTEAVYELLHVRHVWTLFALVAALALGGRE